MPDSILLAPIDAALAPVSLEPVALAYAIVLNSPADTLLEHVGDGGDSKSTTTRRGEICAAVWAAHRVAIDASKLSADERSNLNELLWRRLRIHWRNYGGSSEEAFAWLERRSSEYLHAQPRANSISAASHIVKTLFDATGIEQDDHTSRSRVISSLVGHRIISEVNHLNELKAQFRFV